MALVVTLILLAAIATLAIAFLALTYRETASVDAMGRTTDSELSADSALERAKAETLAIFPIKNQSITNPIEFLGPDMLVSVCCQSTNWESGNLVFPQINRLDSAARLDPTNRYDLAPPVFVNTNRPGQTGPIDDRFFFDFNRNGFFEESGFVPVINDFGQVVIEAGNVKTNFVIGDPHWIGVLQDPRRPHGPDNRYIGRYAFMVLPSGRALDANWIHNNAISRTVPTRSGFHRNQGVGTWELNLAAFLTDLNTNWWQNAPSAPYSYTADPDPTKLSGDGDAFSDARELLFFRFYDDLTLRNSANDLFPFASVFTDDRIDAYADGFIGQTDPTWDDDPSRQWSGSDSPRHFTSPSDFFDRARLPELQPGDQFREKLIRTSSGTSTYDRYTYYRLLQQLGTDSVPEDERKININYVNIPSWNNSGARYKETDLVAWTNYSPGFIANAGRRGSELFVLTVATNIFASETNLAFIATNTQIFPGAPLRIPVFVNGSAVSNNSPLYSSRIHQVLQQAVNIYDASYGGKSNETSAPYFPTVLRPIFQKDRNDIYIVDYVEETGTSLISDPWLQLEDPADRARIGSSGNVNVYGVPILVGARKGLPNFNEFVVQTAVQVSRKMEMRKIDPTSSIQSTNQLLIFSISNSFGAEAWYSYTNAPYLANVPAVYPRQIEIIFGNVMTTVLTNDAGVRLTNSYAGPGGAPMVIPAGSWRGGQFRVPPVSTHITLSNSVYRGATRTFERVGSNNAFDTDQSAYTNRWTLAITNRMLFFMVDSGRIIDAVSLGNANSFFDISSEMSNEKTIDPIDDTFNPTPVASVSEGAINQILVSLGMYESDNSDWSSYGGLDPAVGNDKQKAIDAFRRFVGFPSLYGNTTAVLSNSMQVPFTPIKKFVQTTSWAANDPLVHYRLDDLRDSTNNTITTSLKPSVTVASLTNSHLSKINNRYNPWGKSGNSSSFLSTEKDPFVFNSDFWDFPTNKFPNIGWLGKVHRGTPWQTIYFKAGMAPLAQWRTHTGAAYSSQTHPTNDWRLVDILTAAIHPNATRGQLSINQENLAAWSAVFSGVDVSEVVSDGGGGWIRTNTIVNPLGVDVGLGNNAPLFQLVDGPRGINARRAAFPGGQFRKLSDFLSVPALSDDSAFLQGTINDKQSKQYTATDADYENIAQQVLSLVRLGEPRFVVYAWGQSLKPARFGAINNGGTWSLSGPSIVTSGPDKGLCINYQITGESATRAVVRVEFERDPVTGLTDYGKPHAVVESFNVAPVE